MGIPENDVVTMIQEGLETFYTLEGGRRETSGGAVVVADRD